MKRPAWREQASYSSIYDFQNRPNSYRGSPPLTYKSIHALIEHNLGSRLYRWDPLTPGAHTRVIYLESGLYDQVCRSDDVRIGQLWGDFDHFSLGGMITVGHGREATCFMKLLDPKKNEIWEIRSKDPKPQIRVFGRFADTDVLVATHARRRDELGDHRKSKFSGNSWPEEIKRCKHIWSNVFQNHPAHTGNSVHDYISENAVDVSQLP